MALKGLAKFVVVLTTISAAIMELLDTSIVNVALFNMAGSLGVNVEDVAWVITSYAIANVIVIPLTGFLGEYFGRKNYYIVSMIVFTIASYMCGSSSTLWTLVLWRFIQGIGGGALLSTSQAILFDAFAPEDRAIASGIFGMGVVLGPTLGPTIGGWVMEHLEWPWIFYINLPIGFIATTLAYNFIEKKPNEGKNKDKIEIDYTGIGLLASGVGALQYVLERGEAEDWFASDPIKILAVVALAGLVGFVWRELTIPAPAVRLSVLKNRTLALTNIVSFVVGIGLFTSVYVFPVMVQRINGIGSDLSVYNNIVDKAETGFYGNVSERTLVKEVVIANNSFMRIVDTSVNNRGIYLLNTPNVNVTMHLVNNLVHRAEGQGGKWSDFSVAKNITMDSSNNIAIRSLDGLFDNDSLFYPAKGSYLIDRGTDKTPFGIALQDWGINSDNQNTHRPFGKTYDIGASESRNIEISGKTGQTPLFIYPSVTQDIFNIEMPKFKNEAQLNIYNTTGQVVFSKKLVRDNAGGTLNVEVQNIPVGCYHCVVDFDGMKATAKLLKF